MITLVLPAYNEEANLPALLEKIGQTMAALGRAYRIVVVDDGSRDRTAQVLAHFGKRLPVEVVAHPTNLGLPTTLVDGLRHAALGRPPEDVVITLDADNTHEPHYAAALISRLEEGHDVVIASRYRPGAREVGLSLWRSGLSRGVNTLLALFFPIPGVRDYTCGYRAYRASVLQRAFAVYGEHLVESTTFSAMAEVLLKLGRLGIRAAEVPLVLRYDQKGGTSKMRVAATIFDYLRLMVRLHRQRPRA